MLVWFLNILLLNGKIVSFCKEIGQKDISFHFILPIQRLPRYEVSPFSGVQRKQ